MNLFARVETKWVEYNNFIEHRFVGPMFIVWLIVKTQDKKIPKVMGKIFHFVCNLVDAHMQVRLKSNG